MFVEDEVAAAWDLVGSGFDRAVREDDDAVGAVTRVERWRVSGFAGVSFFSDATALTVFMVGRAGAGASLLDVAAGRVDRAVGLFAALETVVSGDGSGRRTLSKDEFEFSRLPELGRDSGCSFDTSRAVFNFFCGDCRTLVM